MAFRSVPYDSLSLNPFTKIGKEWALLTAGDENGFNTMSVTVYIRPQRYTKEFVDTRDTFTLSFYPAEKKDALSYLGKVSGRDEDKVKKVGFTPAFTNGNAYFEEAELVLVCRKMSRTPLRPEQFLDETVDGRWYPNKDYHEMYIAEVIDVLVKES